jgi:hypothetical protein
MNNLFYFITKKYWWIIAVIIALFLLCLVNIPLPTVVFISSTDMKGLLENRIRDIITVFVLSFTISIFTVTSLLNMKYPNSYIIEFIELSKLIPVIIFFLVTIVFALLSSFLSNTIINYDPNCFSKMISLTYYLLMLGVLLVVIVFIRIFYATNYEFRNKSFLRGMDNGIIKSDQNTIDDYLAKILFDSILLINSDETIIIGRIIDGLNDEYNKIT